MNEEKHVPHIDDMRGTFARAWCACGWHVPWTNYRGSLLELAREHVAYPERWLLTAKGAPS